MGTEHQPPPGGQSFILVPFQSDPATPDPGVAELHLTGWIQRLGPELRIHYRLQGPLGTLLIPTPAELPQRCDDLWTQTCFEAFLAVEGDDPYWEINLSPSGDWNLYRLDGYRQGLAPWAGPTMPPVHCRTEPDQLVLDLECPLPAPIAALAPLQVGITAVIAHRDGTLSTWALTHTGAAADFHRRDSFLLTI